jgi:hypothetical protein
MFRLCLYAHYLLFYLIFCERAQVARIAGPEELGGSLAGLNRTLLLIAAKGL